jgi:oligoribonuclease
LLIIEARRDLNTELKKDRLIWLDMEMSGLDPEKERILELAMVITDGNLEIIAESPVLVIHQEQKLLDGMDSWNQGTHGKSGLIDKVIASTTTEEEAEKICLEFLAEHVKSGASPMCGNTIHQDRRFMAKYMPKLEGYFHYRNIDVSTVKELCKRWQPEVAKNFTKKQAHTAYADIIESIEELRYYRENFFRTPHS